eukprot:4383000-Pleurochrysis_carterae.AAC.1
MPSTPRSGLCMWSGNGPPRAGRRARPVRCLAVRHLATSAARCPPAPRRRAPALCMAGPPPQLLPAPPPPGRPTARPPATPCPRQNPASASAL